jgi:hypothetical protein
VLRIHRHRLRQHQQRWLGPSWLCDVRRFCPRARGISYTGPLPVQRGLPWYKRLRRRYPYLGRLRPEFRAILWLPAPLILNPSSGASRSHHIIYLGVEIQHLAPRLSGNVYTKDGNNRRATGLLRSGVFRSGRTLNITGRSLCGTPSLVTSCSLRNRSRCTRHVTTR